VKGFRYRDAPAANRQAAGGSGVNVHVCTHAMVPNQTTYRTEEELESWGGTSAEALASQDAEIHDDLGVALLYVSGNVLSRSGAWEMNVPG
jgi:hypothetical protein